MRLATRLSAGTDRVKTNQQGPNASVRPRQRVRGLVTLLVPSNILRNAFDKSPDKPLTNQRIAALDVVISDRRCYQSAGGIYHEISHGVDKTGALPASDLIQNESTAPGSSLVAVRLRWYYREGRV